MTFVLVLVVCFATASSGQSGQPTFDELMREAALAQQRKDFATASKKYEAAAQMRPSAAIFEKLGLSYFVGGSYAQAVTAFSRAISRDPKRWPSQLFLGVSLYKMNRFHEALPPIAEALRLDPRQNDTRYWLGCTLHALGNYDEAIARLREATAPDTQNVDILYALTKTYLDYSSALMDRLPPGMPSQQRREALDQQVRDLASPGAEARTRSLEALQTREVLYNVALKSEPPDPEALFALSRVYGQLGQLTAERVWELKPDSGRAHELLGESYDNRQDYQRAVTEFRLALQANPDAPGLHYAVGHAYWEMKRFPEAVPELEKELALNPYHPSANYVLGHIYLRSAPPRPRLAARYLQRAVEANPDFLPARKQWGRALSMMNEDRQAIQQLELAAKQDPRDDSVHYLLADEYKKMGLKEKAQGELEIFNRLRMETHGLGKTRE